ncbi:hypothetical protein KAFR_0B02340 [Kazachstania africana CBS 2517]|uniref:Pea2p n=1 Tax=Kazachstania africana (strain ATCC 22294 / BCRC 22015 / CBS 2517 / CECT 1963 / NBRC 1671 / NRRL Y-8276) TaxID=1071382 RepID=H2AQ82_KAZAF|nr:hypothetical protein KAFR_0B02340 [Kazachstania africana CBS 2517]CCF56532.1 hypothetical protein KAFR_0B02340 [Kazachstania africana CBS 2517]
MDENTVIDYDLLKKANPLLFTQERYDEYPLNPIELAQHLSTNKNQTSSTDLVNRNRPYTDVDTLDYLFYMDDTIEEIDLEKKLACEFAIFQTSLYSKQNSKDTTVTMDKLLNLEIGSDEWCKQMIALLNSINGTNLSVSRLKHFTKNHNDDMENNSNEKDDSTSFKNDQMEIIQEITSYLLSNSIKNGIELKPNITDVDDPLKFLKSNIDSLLEVSKSNTIVKNHADTNNKVDEINTAFEDLKLAHNFLTKQYEHDRSEHSKDVEKLNRTNKELQEKLLQYHSLLTKNENNTDNTRSTSNSDLWNQNILNSPDLNSSNHTSPNGSYSLSIMRNEFKRLLMDTQRKYETELENERKFRIELEKKLDSLEI